MYIYIYIRKSFLYYFFVLFSRPAKPCTALHKVHHIRKVRPESDQKCRRWDCHRLLLDPRWVEDPKTQWLHRGQHRLHTPKCGRGPKHLRGQERQRNETTKERITIAITILLNWWILLIGGASLGRVCACSLCSRLFWAELKNIRIVARKYLEDPNARKT